MSRIINFLKYNNATIFILLAIFLLAGGVFAQTETGQDLIGQKETRIEGTDNTLLLEADLDKFNMDFKIEKIESDEKYYYVTYTYLDLLKKENIWQYEMSEKVRKVSKNLSKDLGVYMAEELSEQNLARISDLKKLQKETQDAGEEKRIEQSEYSGLIGQSLELASKIFPDYEPIEKKELPSPSIPDLLTLKDPGLEISSPDNLTNIYNDYIEKVDIDNDELLGDADNCPDKNNPTQTDSDGNGVGDACENKIIENIEAPVETISETSPNTTVDSASEVEIITESEIDSATSEPLLEDTIPSSETGSPSANDGETIDSPSPESSDVEVITIN